MAQRSNGTRPKTAQQRRSSGEIDRYHYVDRDIYSRSNRRVSTASHKGPAKKRRKRKKSAGRRVIAAILVLAGEHRHCLHAHASPRERIRRH